MNTELCMSRGGLRTCAVLGSVMALLTAGCASVTQTSAAHANASTVARVTNIASRYVANASSDDLARSLEPFPPAAPGYIRWVIDVPPQTHEDRIKIEWLPSIRMRTDCNHHRASAKVESHTVPGWGYTYQVMGDIGPVVATLMGCPPEETRERDVPIHTDLALQRYNSHAPIVFYTPARVTLRYRVWRAEGEAQSAVPSPSHQ